MRTINKLPRPQPSSNLQALVTGAARGIGAAVAKTLARDGYTVWINYKSRHDEAKKLQAEIESTGGSCQLLPFDVSVPSEVDEALDIFLDNPEPYILVNNAGIARDNMLGLMSPEDWDQVFEINLKGFFLVTRKIIPHLQRLRRGSIVNMVSVSGQIGQAGQVNYSASKAGLIGATRALAREVASRNIQVNAVAPGLIKTEMIDSLPLDQILPHIPLGRIGKPEEVAEAVSFLCSPGAYYITGQVLSVNGGLYL